MDQNITRKLARNSFLLSVLLHLLFLLLVTTVVFLQPEKQKIPPQVYTPAYVYKGAMTPSVSRSSKQATAHQETSRNTQATPIHAKSSIQHTTRPMQQKSFMDMSRDVIRSEQMQATMNTFENVEPILMIGDPNQPPDPFLKELARCLSANLHYPTMEGELGSHGRVLVSMIVHPEGDITNVQIVRSSDNPHFDNAALYASNQAPTLRGANRFLNKPKYFVVGFIFN